MADKKKKPKKKKTSKLKTGRRISQEGVTKKYAKTTKKPKLKKKKKITIKKKKSRKKSDKKSFWGLLIKWGFVSFIWAFLSFVVLCAWYSYDLPDVNTAKSYDKKHAIIIKSENNKKIGHYGGLDGEVVSVSDLPSHVPSAILAIEDHRFYDHFGVDIWGLVRATSRNIIAGKVVQGGSSITQQLAKNLFLTPDRTFKRKMQELILSFWLEYNLTKDEILTAYLNRVYFGAGVYGVDAASQRYFNKSAKKLKLWEATILAGMLKAPSKYSPISNQKLSEKRAEVVLRSMYDKGYITKRSFENPAGKKALKIARINNKSPNKYLADWVVSQIPDLIGRVEQDIIVTTSLNLKAQKIAQKHIKKMIKTSGKDKNINQISLVSMKADGRIISMIGGLDYKKSQFNRVTQSKRQVGSIFKVFVYLSALEHGYRINDKILDAPIIQGKYKPRNFGDNYLGDITLVQALSISSNTATLRLAKDVGLMNIIKTAQKLGIKSKIRRDMSSILGSSEASLLELANAFSYIANDGYKVKPYAVLNITDRKGNILYRRPENPLNASSRYKDIQGIQYMLNSVVQTGTGKKAYIENISKIGGKTGTSQDYKDAWFVGYADDLVTGIWLGNDNNSPMDKITGGSLPAQLWHDFTIDMMKRNLHSRF